MFNLKIKMKINAPNIKASMPKKKINLPNTIKAK
jgi:hypothetical protein